MAGYGQFCPIAQGAEVLAQPWTPLVLRELLAGSHRFSDLQRGLPGMSRSLLSSRLRSLERAGLLERRARENGYGHDYHPTRAGEDARAVVVAIGEWGYAWGSNELKPRNLDAGLLLWFMRRRMRTDNFPAAQTVIQFEFTEPRRRSFWMILNRPGVEVCLTDPGFPIDVHVTAALRTLTQVYLGRIGLRDAIANHTVELAGDRALCRAFPDWYGVSPYAPADAAKAPADAKPPRATPGQSPLRLTSSL
jgi:DNA-binding HxlR family transcriptional regulator